MSAAVERRGEAHGLSYVVLWVHGSHRCGYVAVPESHPWHGVKYNQPAPTVPVDNGDFKVDDDIGVIAAFCYGISDDERRAERDRCPEYQIAVHGGLTYSGEGGGDFPPGWVFGFDCAHSGDSPGEWTTDRVEAECCRLAEQLAHVASARSVA